MNKDYNENVIFEYNYVKEICHIYESKNVSSFAGNEVHITIVKKDEKIL